MQNSQKLKKRFYRVNQNNHKYFARKKRFRYLEALFLFMQQAAAAYIRINILLSLFYESLTILILVITPFHHFFLKNHLDLQIVMRQGRKRQFFSSFPPFVFGSNQLD